MEKEPELQEQEGDRKRGRWGILAWLVWLLIFPLCLCLASQLAVWGPHSTNVALGAGGPGPDYSVDEGAPPLKPLSYRIIEEIIADQVLETFLLYPGEAALEAIVAERVEQVPALPSSTATSAPMHTSTPETSPTPTETTLPPYPTATPTSARPAFSPSPSPTSIATSRGTPTTTPTLTSTPTTVSTETPIPSPMPTGAPTNTPTSTPLPQPR